MTTALTLLKPIVALAIATAVGIELWLDSVGTTAVPAVWVQLQPLIRIGLIGHLVEGILAAIRAPHHNKDPWRYSVYTFFVGFIGLVELAQDPASSSDS